MKFDCTIHHRRSIRLKGYDYSAEGMYFVTVCAKDRICLFGALSQSTGTLTEAGNIAQQCWLEIPDHFPGVELDEYVIMPNHLHGILFLKVDSHDPVGVEYIQPQRGKPRDVRSQYQHVVPNSVGSVIRSYKAAVTRICRRRGIAQVCWQRNYYEHIIRDGEDLDRIREYIRENPLNWTVDEEFPGNIRMDRLHKGSADWSPLD